MTKSTVDLQKGHKSDINNLEHGLKDYKTIAFDWFKPGVPRIITNQTEIEEKILRQKSKPINGKDFKTALLIGDLLIKALEASSEQVDMPGVGLSAVQIGLLAQIFVANIKGKMQIFINPQITFLDNQKTAGVEGCLSLPGVEVVVPRYNRVRLKYIDINGNVQNLILKGFNARVVQHEYDHLFGRLIVDYV